MSLVIWMCLDCVCLELAARWLQLRDNEISRVRRREGPYSDLSPQMKPHLGSFSIPRQLVCGGRRRPCSSLFIWFLKVDNLTTSSNLQVQFK